MIIKKIVGFLIVFKLLLILFGCSGYTDFTIKGAPLDTLEFASIIKALELNNFNQGYLLTIDGNSTIDNDFNASLTYRTLCYFGSQLSDYQNYECLEFSVSDQYWPSFKQLSYTNQFYIYQDIDNIKMCSENELSEDSYQEQLQKHLLKINEGFFAINLFDEGFLDEMLLSDSLELKIAKNRGIYTLGLVVEIPLFFDTSEVLAVAIDPVNVKLRIQIRYQNEQLIDVKMNGIVDLYAKFDVYKEHYFEFSFNYNLSSIIDFNILPSQKELLEYS